MGELTVRRKKKAATLPRITLLAYNRRDLLAFVEAVAKLEHIAADLLAVASQLPKPKPKKLPAVKPPLTSGSLLDSLPSDPANSDRTCPDAPNQEGVQ